MTEPTRTIHLAFGPVQDFVAQARRTRDLQAGSYLLSYLAASALSAATRAGGTIVLPAVENNPLWLAVSRGWDTLNEEQRRAATRTGSVPHVAQISAPATSARSVAEAAVSGWREAWSRIAGAVREYACGAVLPRWDEATERIWQRQIGEAWTHTWTITEDPATASRRKSLRGFSLHAEPGEKCTCCGHRQALHAGSETRRPAVRDYWAAAASGREMSMELREGGAERLCAVCTVKRFFPYVARDAIGWNIDRSYPSTSAFASFGWRAQVLTRGVENPSLRAAVTAAVAALQHAQAPQTDDAAFPWLRERARGWGTEQQAAGAFIRYDEEWFTPDAITAAREPVSVFAGEEHRRTRSDLAASARRLLTAAREAGAGAPGTDYALLVMDGDKMGDLLRHHPSHTKQISQALGAFAAGAQRIVEQEHHGLLIYAGGDDVLAMLPPACALPAARDLRAAYRSAFQQHAETVAGASTPSISAGLLYSHAQTPLRTVVQEGHRLLDEVAKERGKRDAIAIAVHQRGGASLTFAAKWESAAVTRVMEVAAEAAGDGYSRGFLYDLQRLLPLVDALPDEQTARRLLVVDYLQGDSRKPGGGAGLEVAERRVGAVLALKPQAGTGERWDVIRLALWLAGTVVERESHQGGR